MHNKASTSRKRKGAVFRVIISEQISTNQKKACVLLSPQQWILLYKGDMAKRSQVAAERSLSCLAL